MSGVLHGVTAKCRAFSDFLLEANLGKGPSDFLLEANLGKELDLPQIAALGDTSSGKSSVLSAISSVVFPSRNNITTRCPTRLCMDTGDSFRCKMQVIWHSMIFHQLADRTHAAVAEMVDVVDFAAAVL
jgi:hypothetical protein